MGKDDLAAPTPRASSVDAGGNLVEQSAYQRGDGYVLAWTREDVKSSYYQKTQN
jgi:hypothetical protein